MPVVSWEPEDLSQAQVIVAYSDASDMLAAIRDIDEWARERGLVRARENWLAQTVRNGKSLYRGACYQPLTAEQRALEEQHLHEAEARRKKMPPTSSSDRLHEDAS